MAFRLVVGLLGGVSCLLFATLSQAQCAKDTDCKGDRICEAGVCQTPAPVVTPTPAPAVTPAPPADAAPPVVAEPTAPVAAPAPVAGPHVIQVYDAPIDDRAYSVTESDERSKKRNWKRHSTGMMVGGIVMTSLSGVAFMVSLLGGLANASCDSYDYQSSASYSYYRDCNYDGLVYGGLVTGLVLAGVGIPMIVVGGKKEPRGTASVTPWATPNAGGLKLSLSL